MAENKITTVANASFTPYINKSGHSGIVAYEAGSDNIIIQFNDGEMYLYTYSATGEKHVEEMKRLAQKGEGLTTYINKNIRERFQRKLKKKRIF